MLGRIETRTLDDARQSASSAVRSAENQLAVAQREVERTETAGQGRRAGGARPRRGAEPTSAAVEAQLADAKSRLASAERQLGDAVIRAPLDRHRVEPRGQRGRRGQLRAPSSSPSSIRRRCGSRRRCRPTTCRRCGSAPRWNSPFAATIRRFTGRIERIAPQADATTRQVPIYVAIPNVGGRLVAGLFAEGGW